MTIHPRLTLPPVLPALVPLPPSLTDSQLLTLAAVFDRCAVCDREYLSSPTLRSISEALGVRFAANKAIRADLDALVELGRVEVVQYTNCRAFKITAIGRWHFTGHTNQEYGGARKYVRSMLARRQVA